MSIKIKSKFTKEIVTYRFMSDKYANSFWFSTEDDERFDLGECQFYTPIKTTWIKLKEEHKKIMEEANEKR